MKPIGVGNLNFRVALIDTAVADLNVFVKMKPTEQNLFVRFHFLCDLSDILHKVVQRLRLYLQQKFQTQIMTGITSIPKKVITLDKLFTGNDQRKTNAVLQMKDAEIDFKTI